MAAFDNPISPADRGYGNRRLTQDDLDTLHGAGVVTPRKTRNLRVVKRSRHNAPVDRTVRDGSGDPHPRFARTRTASTPNRIVVVKDVPRKRANFAIGATYGDSWQRSADTDNHDNRPSLARKGAGDSIEWAS